MEKPGLPFQSLQVWQKAVQLCDDILSETEKIPRLYQFSLADQLRRSVLSIPTNIAEGAGRDGQADRNRFFTIARGSAFETSSLLEIAKRRRCISEEKVKEFEGRLIEIVRMLSGLIKSEFG